MHPQGRDCGHHRHQRLGEVHHPEDHHRRAEPHGRRGGGERAHLRAAGAGSRIQSGVQRNRERLSERHHDGLFRQGN